MLLREGGAKGRNPPDGADWPMPRCGGILLEFMFEEPTLLRPELTGPVERVLLGGANGRNPPPLFGDWVMPRCDGMVREPVFEEPTLARPELTGPNERLLFGG